MLEKSTYYILASPDVCFQGFCKKTVVKSTIGNAQGNQMSMYDHKVNDGGVVYYLADRNIYGSSRLGSLQDTVNMFIPTTLPSYGVVGNRNYELSNHLGNVLTVINDVVYPLTENSTTVSGYEVGLTQVSDYSPFGVQLDGRTMENGEYRYGFNGMEMDDEIKGKGNSYTTHFRQYDPRVGRWLSIDPKARKYPATSPYVFSANSPNIFTDPGGDTLFIAGKIAVSFKDIQSLIPEKYRSMIKKTDDNRIIFEGYENLPDEIKKYKGVNLLHKLVADPEKFKYKVGDDLKGKDRLTGTLFKNQPYNVASDKEPTALGAILNLSITKRTDLDDSDVQNSLPEDNFAGAVLIQDGEFTRDNSATMTGDFPTDRNTFVFHELIENYLRFKGDDYGGRIGAHETAIKEASKFSKEVNGKRDPLGGTASGFKKNE